MAKMLGIGTVLKCSTAGSTVFGVTVGQVRSVSRSGLTADDIDTRTLDDAPNATFAPGWLDGGVLNFQVAYDNSDAQVVLHSVYRNRVTAKWQLIHATTTIVEEFDGYINSISREIPIDGMVVQDFGVKVTGNAGLDVTT